MGMLGAVGGTLFSLHYDRDVRAISLCASRLPITTILLITRHTRVAQYCHFARSTVCSAKFFLGAMGWFRASMWCTGACSPQLMVGFASTPSCFSLCNEAVRFYQCQFSFLVTKRVASLLLTSSSHGSRLRHKTVDFLAVFLTRDLGVTVTSEGQLLIATCLGGFRAAVCHIARYHAEVRKHCCRVFVFAQQVFEKLGTAKVLMVSFCLLHLLVAAQFFF